MARARNGNEIVDLVSDSEDEAPSEDGLDFFDAHDQPQDEVALFPGDQNVDHIIRELNARYHPVYEAADGIIDLTNIPDIDVPPFDPILDHTEFPAQDELGSDDQLITEAVSLQMIIDVLPDISIDHVLGIIREKTTDLTRTTAKCHEIISQLVDQETYPKEDDEAKNKKRKRGDEDDWKEYDKTDRNPAIPTYETDVTELLKDEFLSVPARHITNVVREHNTLFRSYLILEQQTRNYQTITKKDFSKIGRARNLRGVENILIERGSQVPKELHAVKKKIESEMAKRRKAEQQEQAEADNRADAEAHGRMGECACCFADAPLNRMVSCNGDTTHSYCLECPKRQVETQMGVSNCRPKCFGVDNCNGTFARKDLQQVLGDKTFDRLEHLQQQEDLASAGLDFLSECPFCDFKMECPPVGVDKEFRCQNTKCGKTSCRLCEKETHIPLTCKEADKDDQITFRHIVEEAMSAALIRQCNRCKHPFVKEYGCNKMTCSHCRNVQCYVCSKNVTNYEHFGEVGQGRCPLNENVEDRHEQEVKKAADEAMAKVRADNPSLSDADLMIKVSDRVKQAEDARKGRAQVQANAFPYHMVGDQLQNHAGPPLVPALYPPVQPMAPVAQYVPVHPYAVAPAPFFVHPQPLAQVPQYLQPVQQPVPYHHNDPGQAALQPHQPAGYGFNVFPMNRIFGAYGQAQPQQQQQNAPPPPPPAYQPYQPYLQDPPPQPQCAPLDANNLNQRLDQLGQQQQAQILVQRRLRLLNLQQINLVQENLARQRELLQQDDGAIMQNMQAQPRYVDHMAEARRQRQRHRPR